ncbi:MAG: hypothetical protein M5U28_56395 [Sandaracinaceae bacterium]|nr:hypothetical protein [Sandaracinaceae bacterium]
MTTPLVEHASSTSPDTVGMPGRCVISSTRPVGQGRQSQYVCEHAAARSAASAKAMRSMPP